MEYKTFFFINNNHYLAQNLQPRVIHTFLVCSSERYRKISLRQIRYKTNSRQLYLRHYVLIFLIRLLSVLLCFSATYRQTGDKTTKMPFYSLRFIFDGRLVLYFLRIFIRIFIVLIRAV